MSRARAGEILSTDAVHERSHTLFATTPIEPFRAKGKAEPVTASIVGEIVGRRTERGAEAPFVGRDEVVAALLSIINDVLAGNAWAVEVAGDPPGNTHEYRAAVEVVLKATDPTATIVVSEVGEVITPRGGELAYGESWRNCAIEGTPLPLSMNSM